MLALFISIPFIDFKPPKDPLDQFIQAQSAIGTEENPLERIQYESRMLADPATGRIPDNIRRREFKFSQKIPSRILVNKTNHARSTSIYEAGEWKSNGPDNVGGRTRALAIDVRNENIILAGGVSGGMWRSEDDGLSWEKVTNPGNIHSVTC